MDVKTADLILKLEVKDWKEPTKEEYPSYWDCFESKEPRDFYFEDIHFVWVNYQPKIIKH